jgi:hypothetical protein
MAHTSGQPVNLLITVTSRLTGMHRRHHRRPASRRLITGLLTIGAP